MKYIYNKKYVIFFQNMFPHMVYYKFHHSTPFSKQVENPFSGSCFKELCTTEIICITSVLNFLARNLVRKSKWCTQVSAIVYYNLLEIRSLFWSMFPLTTLVTSCLYLFFSKVIRDPYETNLAMLLNFAQSVKYQRLENY